MRVNIYAEELSDVDLIEKEVEGQRFTAVRFWLEPPVSLKTAVNNTGEPFSVPPMQEGLTAKGPFMHRPGDDDSSAVTFWGKRELIPLLERALGLLKYYYGIE